MHTALDSKHVYFLPFLLCAAKKFKAKCNPCLPFLHASFWGSIEDPLKPRFINAPSSTSLLEVLSDLLFLESYPDSREWPVGCKVCKKLMSPLRIVRFLGSLKPPLDIVKLSNCPRSNANKPSSLLLQFSDFSTQPGFTQRSKNQIQTYLEQNF
jgi:hypothetical protein